MMIDRIFPAAEGDGCEPHRRLAERLKCSENLIHACASGLEAPEWIGPRHIDKVRDHTDAINKARRAADALARNLSRLDDDTRTLLLQAGCISHYQVQHLKMVLESDTAWLKEFIDKNPRPGGRNPAAHAVAKIVLRAFRVLDKKITWGVFEGFPTTEYGKTVDYAFTLFGIESDWRRPAEAVLEEHNRRQDRYMQFRLARFQTNSPETN